MEDSVISWGILLCVALVVAYIIISKCVKEKSYTESTYVSSVYSVNTWGGRKKENKHHNKIADFIDNEIKKAQNWEQNL